MFKFGVDFFMRFNIFSRIIYLLLLLLVLACSKSTKKQGQDTSSNESPVIVKKEEDKKDDTQIVRQAVLKKLFYNTTLSQTLKPVVPAENPKDSQKIPKEIESKFGFFEKGKGESHIMRNDGEVAIDKEPPKDISLLLFSHFTDVHITDEEAPGRATLSEVVSFAKDAYRPQQDLTLQVFNAAIRTINEINDITAIDFILSTGDVVDSSLYNELRWFIDTFDGKNVNPDSGTDEDPQNGPLNDSSDEFKAVGTKIPWYVTTGNHNYVKGLITHAKLGEFNDIVEKMKDPFEIPGLIKVNPRIFYIDDPMGDYSNAVIVPHSPELSLTELNSLVGTLKEGKIAPDSNRRFVGRKEFISEFFNSSSMPSGHGFSKTNVESGCAYYTFQPKKEIPIRIIALDTMNYDGGWSEGDLSRKQIDNFLIPELEKAKKNQELVIITAHHPISSIQTNFDIRRALGIGGTSSKEGSYFRIAEDSTFGVHQSFTVDTSKEGTDPLSALSSLFTHSEDAVSGEQLGEILLEYPNVILYLAGDSHDNRVTYYKGKDGGFWHIITSSLIDYPQQTRLLEIVYDGNGIGSIYSTMVDFNSEKGSLPYLSRSLALADVQYGKIGDDSIGRKEDRNVILKFHIPKEISSTLDKLELK